MKIGIIGAGNIGGDLARKFIKQGHTVRVSNSRGPDSLREFEAETGAIASTAEEVVSDSELIVVSVQLGAIPSLKALFANVPSNVIVIDTSNYYRMRDGDIPDILECKYTHSQWVETQLGHAVVKVFNSIGTQSLIGKNRPVGHAERIALPVAADSAEHKKVVMELVESIGFDAVDSGSIADSWRQAPAAPAYCTDLSASELPDALQRAVREELEIRNAVVITAIFSRSADPNKDGVDISWLREEVARPFEDVRADFEKLQKK